MPFKYTQDQITEALTAMAFCGGSPTEAAKYLTFEPKPDRNTLGKWKGETYRDLYMELSVKLKDEIEKHALRAMREMVTYSTMVEQKALEAVNSELDAGRLKGQYAAQTVAQLAKARGDTLTKVFMVEGRPTEIKEVRSVDEIARKLKKLGVDNLGDLIPSVPVAELAAGDG